ncbi:MAG: transglycosylase SLT domain-containing protein [Deltaproteobacteria bacterium]
MLRSNEQSANITVIDEDTVPAKTIISIPESKKQKKGNGDELFDEALFLVKEANENIANRKNDRAIELLDKAYSLILSTDENNKQRDDLRLLISKSLVTAYGASIATTSKNKSEIPLVMNPDVEYEIRSFQTRERDFFISAYEKSSLYRAIMVKELRKAGLPEELSWLPLVESGFKIKAFSRARALGLWQFIPSTGYRYGLMRDEWIDERMDVLKSTGAAIAYMSDMHKMFGDWLTVLAAYNCGEGRVMRLIKKQDSDYADYFWDLYRQLPRETARYVPRFLAVLHITNDPEKYGFNLAKISDRSVSDYKIIKTNKPMLLSNIAQYGNVSAELLSEFNPELRFQATPNREYALRVPRDSASTIEQIIDKVPLWRIKVAKDRVGHSFVTHEVKAGESLASIAKKYGTTTKSLRNYNRQALRGGMVSGIQLTIPVRSTKSFKKDSKKNASTAKEHVKRYKVKKGDTLLSISRKTGVSATKIKGINNIKGNTVKTGQSIRLE